MATVQALGIGQAISVRLGDGFQVIERGEADTIVIAGMGGELISEILERGEAKLTRETTLILQPNIREVTLRTWLDQHQWTIVDEAIRF
ncbi:tRNA (adenine(22)-N(1))-methyltransferase TrmK [Terrilactibacillus sp. S3-3]|nr:tRNA (adenine(22)-N(1))-methyltransferase TrmK [Terrilactibacillus sp. S3-3]